MALGSRSSKSGPGQELCDISTVNSNSGRGGTGLYAVLLGADSCENKANVNVSACDHLPDLGQTATVSKDCSVKLASACSSDREALESCMIEDLVSVTQSDVASIPRSLPPVQPF